MGYHFSSRLTATLNLCLIYCKITWALAILLEYMHKKFEIDLTKIEGGCQSGRKVVIHNSKSDLTLARDDSNIEINSFDRLHGWYVSPSNDTAAIKMIKIISMKSLTKKWKKSKIHHSTRWIKIYLSFNFLLYMVELDLYIDLDPLGIMNFKTLIDLIPLSV